MFTVLTVVVFLRCHNRQQCTWYYICKSKIVLLIERHNPLLQVDLRQWCGVL